MTSMEIKKLNCSRSWSHLPIEMLTLVASRLPLSAHVRLASVCKAWMQCSSLVYPADHGLLVLLKNPAEARFSYYSPYHNLIFTPPPSENLPAPAAGEELRFRSAKHGWILLTRGSSDVLLINPLSGASHGVPPLPAPLSFPFRSGMAFSASPLCGDAFMIFAISYICGFSVAIRLCRGGRKWTPIVSYTSRHKFFPSPSSPVFSGGLFYCLGEWGELGVFDPTNYTWTVLDKPKPVRTKLQQEEQDRYLMESGGHQLFMVELGNHCSPINVLRLNSDDGVWKPVRSLGKRMLAIGGPSSILTMAPTTAMENKIYLRRVRRDPEAVDAQVQCSEGRFYFVSKRSLACKLVEGEGNPASGGPCSSSLDASAGGGGQSFEYHGSKEYVCSIWYEPKMDP